MKGKFNYPHFSVEGVGLADFPEDISIQFSCSVVSDSLPLHGLQHARPPCPSPTPGVYSNSCPLSWWCHPTISSSVILFSSCSQSLSAWGSLQMSQCFASGGQSFSFTISPSNENSGLISFRMDRLDLPAVQGTLKSLLQHHGSKASISFIYSPTLTSHTWLLERPEPWLDRSLLTKQRFCFLICCLGWS